MAGNDPQKSRTERLVFILHGILLNRWFLAPMAAFLAARGFRVVNRSYPSTRRTIEQHAAALGRVVEEESHRLEEAGVPYEVNFVTHSLGGLVVRYLLTHADVPRARRAVLLVPPNNGSLKARRFRRTLLYRLLYGARDRGRPGPRPAGSLAQCGSP